MKYSKIIAILILIMTIVVACSKGNGNNTDEENPVHVSNPTDTQAPVLDIYTPVVNQIFNNGTTISVTGKITDDLGLYRGKVKITDDATGFNLKEQAYEIHGVLSYNFTVNYTPVVSSLSNYTVTVSFEDHGNNSTTKSVKVSVNP